MRCEAKPYIDLLSLKRDPTFNNIEVYTGDDIKLCITGIGKADAASAVSILLASVADTDRTIVVNIGTAAGDISHSGKMFRISRIHDEDSGKDQYPDMLWKTSFPEVCLHTSDGYKLDDVFSDDISDFVCDMEGSAIFRAAANFISPDRIIMLKAVSDSGSPESVTEQLCIDLMSRFASGIVSEVTKISSELPVSDKYQEAETIRAKYSELLHCTGYMDNSLSRLIRFAMSEGIDIDSMLASYLPVASKEEGKKVLQDVERKLVIY